MRIAMMPYPVMDLHQTEFKQGVTWLGKQLSETMVYNRGRVHAQDVSDRPEFGVHELHNVMMTYDAPKTMRDAQSNTGANLPWAEDHFQERVGGKPLNPSPSEAWWPFAVKKNKVHKEDEQFSHTYPERMWPKWADGGQAYSPEHPLDKVGHKGIRYDYGDLDDLVSLLERDPFTRQAYLPIWFPEDTGSVSGQRVPCSLGYHFIRRGYTLDCQYFIRSCDFFRHFADDVYMAVRLMQWVCGKLQEHDMKQGWKKGIDVNDGPYPFVGKLTMFISNLHCFRGDEYRFKS